MGPFLTTILIVSFFFRSFLVTHVPPELFGDEIDVGYQAYSLLKTGQDLYGRSLPIYVSSLSEPRAALVIYSTVPTVAVFGLNEYGVRLPEVVFGSLSPLILFLLVYQVSRSKLLSAFSALMLIFMPWHILYSRAAFEVVILIDYLMLAALLFIKRKYILSSVLFALTFYIYSTAVVFAPLLILMLIIYRRRWPSLGSVLVFGLFLIPFALNIFSGKAGSRFGLISVFNSPAIIENVTNLRKEHPAVWEPLFHNKYLEIVRLVSENYLRAYSPDFLFVRGDPIVRHSIQAIGQLLPITAPIFILGLYYLASRRSYFWLGWLLLAPIPSALTVDGANHATRLFLMVPPVAVALGAGLLAIKNFKYKFLNYGVILLLSANFVWAAHYYLVHYPTQSWRWWQVGYRSSLTELHKIDQNYSYVFINNTYEPSLERFLFYTRFSPAKFHQLFTLDQSKPDIVPGYDGFSLGPKYYFGHFSALTAQKSDFSARLRSHSLYLISQRDDVPGDWDWRVSPPQRVKVLFTSTDPYNRPLFYLVTKYDPLD